MRLAFVSDFYYPSIGGTQMLCKGLAEWFRDQGHEIEIITSPDAKREDMGYKVHELNGASFAGSNILLEENYDAVFVLADLFSPSIMSMNAGDARKSILILNLDENVYRWIKEGRIKDVAQRVERIKRFSHVVSFCQGAPVNKFLNENDIKHHFIPNFSRDVKNGPISDKITKEALGISKKIIFNHGLIETRKNQLNLMKSFLDSGLSDDHHLVLLGSPRSGGDMKYFLECKKLCDSSDSITMIKGTNNQTIINSLLNISDVYILPSTAEGLPLVLLEAMSAGLPWVSTPVGGVPAVFGPLKEGKVLDSFDLSSLEEAIREVEDRDSREEWESLFTIERAGQQYNEVLTTSKNIAKEKRKMSPSLPFMLLGDTTIAYHPTPKCACSSVKAMLNYAKYKTSYEDFEELHKLYLTRKFVPFEKACFKFCIVRDPVDRFISGYSNRVLFHKDIEPVSFDEFVRNFDLYFKNPMINHHFLPQVYYIGKNPNYYSKIFNIKDMAEVPKALAEMVGFEIPNFKEQTGGSDKKPTPSKEQVDFIRDFYKEDYNFLKNMEKK